MNATWNLTETGMVFHSFNADGAAICRSNIKVGSGRKPWTESQMDKSLASVWGMSTQGYRKCASCAKKEAAFQARLEASLAPSTGEGDHLPPAGATEEIVAESDTDEGESVEDTKPVKVRFAVTVEVDPIAWALEYGNGEGRREVMTDVREYLLNAIREGNAGFELMKIVGTN